MLEILLITIWSFLVTYATWYFTLAKHYAPITLLEAKILWKIHKRNFQCDSRKWRGIKRGNKIIGFECGCGYKHIQKRPIAGNKPILNVKLQNPQDSAFDRLHTSY